MPISPWVQGSLDQWKVTFQTTDPNNPTGPPKPYSLVGLTASAISVTIRNMYLPAADANYERAGTGTWTIVDAVNGIATYDPSAADVAGSGLFELIFTIIQAGNSKPKKWPPQTWQVLTG